MAVVAVVSMVGAGLAGGVAAQTRTEPAKSEPARAAFERPANSVDTKSLIGVRIRDAQGKDIGEIDQLLIDPQGGKVTHAVIGVGGLMGVGETHVVVPWSDVKLSADRDKRDAWVVQMDRATLDRAPRWERKAADRPSATPRTEPTTTPRGSNPTATPSTR
jgi:sporulation protein YlmC with PRC-barrel domain